MKNLTCMLGEEKEEENHVVNDDLIVEILSKASTKALFRFTCTSKVWRNLISQYFAPVVITEFYYGENSFSFDGSSTINSYNKQIDLSLKFLHRNILVVAYHNGYVLCVEEQTNGGDFGCHRRHCYVLCNPLTKQSLSLPKPHECHNIKNAILFCCEESDKHLLTEFKVLSILSCWNSNGLEVEVYSSKRKSWSKLRIPYGNSCKGTSLPDYCMVGGLVYLWKEYCSRVCVYDLSTEKTRFIKPPIQNSEPPLYFSPTLLGSSSGSVYYATMAAGCFNVWVLLDNGVEWTLKHSIDLKSFNVVSPEDVLIRSWLYPLAFHPTNDSLVLVALGYARPVVLFDMVKRQIVYVERVDYNRLYPIVPYVFPVRSSQIMRS